MNSTKYFRRVIQEELSAIKDLLSGQRILLFILALVFLAITIYLKPIQPSRIIVAGANENSAYGLFVNFSKEFFKKRGIDLVFKETSGAIENAELLRQDSSGVDVAFIQGGSITESELGKIHSLGSIAYEPVWIFYKKPLLEKVKSLQDLAHYRIGVGPKKGGTQALVKQLYKIENIDIDTDPHFVFGEYEDNKQDFYNGKLDAIIQVTPYNDPDVQELLDKPQVGIFNFSQALAYEKNITHIIKLTMPAGSHDIHKNIPPTDINLISTTTSLVVRDDLHEDIQMLLLMAAKEENRNSKFLFFNKRDEFPAYVDPSIPISPTAVKYYDYGLPSLMRYLPFWLAGFVNRLWILLLAIATIAYPLSKMNLKTRAIRFKFNNRHMYEQIIELEKDLYLNHPPSKSKEELTKIVETLNTEALQSKIPVGLEKDYFEVVHAIELLRLKIERLES